MSMPEVDDLLQRALEKKIERLRKRGRPTKHTNVDWQAVEADFRAGVLTRVQICAKYDINRVSLADHIRRGGWQQDLTDRVMTAANAKLAAQAATITRAKRVIDRAMAPPLGAGPEGAAKAKVARAEAITALTVEAAAAAIAQIVERQRSDLHEARALVRDLLGELRTATLGRAEFERVLELATSDMTAAEAQELRSVFQRALGMIGRIGGVQKLADAMGKLHTMEDRAWRIGGESPGTSWEDLLRSATEDGGGSG